MKNIIKQTIIIFTIMLSVLSAKAQVAESMGSKAHHIEELVQRIKYKYVDFSKVKQEYGDNIEMSVYPFSIPLGEENSHFLLYMYECFENDVATTGDYTNYLPNEGYKTIATLWNGQTFILRSKYGTEILAKSTYILDGKYKGQDIIFIVTLLPQTKKDIKNNIQKGRLYVCVNHPGKITLIGCEKITGKNVRKS